MTINPNFKTLALSVILIVVVLPAQAQIQLGGLLDVELRQSGPDSSPYVNQSPVNGNWTLYTPYLRLFVNGAISEEWFVSAVLQADYYDGRHLSPVFFSVINANWQPVGDSDFLITAGRFVTPYGTYAERLLSSENPFVHLPLSHASGLPLSKIRGILPMSSGYDPSGVTTMVYQRMYTQGIRLSNQVGRTDWLRYMLAATLAPASSHFEVGEHTTPAITGRIVLQPAIWGRAGFSFSYGSFMKRDVVNLSISDSRLSSYTQTLLGVDMRFSYLYYSFLVEYNRSRWKAPYINPLGVVVDEELWADIDHLAAETTLRFPFWPGSYAALRYELLLSGDLSSPLDGYADAGEAWTYNRERIETVLGYKLNRNALLKLSYLHSMDSGPNLDDDVIALQLSLGF